ncbi:MAG TPA: radical SAM family heme chaperone HemW [Vicinamibacterales bacterium]|jgi:oxygen-independent coproporphyrinogen-3 oxidase|nr:radical SAM family heme chaperone HemW [Vicinamibacterales bacterium]
MLGLYLHVPFCQAICSYCNFNRGLFDASLKTRYVDALEREIVDAGDGRAADTIFFGGGTPSLLEPDEIAQLVGACRSAFHVMPDAEVTLEANPETVSVSRMAAYLDAGITRVSMGAQTFDAEQLRRLGRIHTAERIVTAVTDARRAGVTNLSLDLMFWLPGQSRSSWLDTVDRAIALEPDHLSLYLLELYPNAPLREAMARAAASGVKGTGDWAQAADDEAADMYLEAFERLDRAGLRQYEISNAARPGRESRHNLKYWTSGAWRGFGCGAHTTLDGGRWHNLASTIEYIDRMAQGRAVASSLRTFTAVERVQEALFTGLRLTRGIERSPFRARYGVDPWERYGASLTTPIEAGLMWTTGEAFGLTRSGMLMANEILATFV